MKNAFAPWRARAALLLALTTAGTLLSGCSPYADTRFELTNSAPASQDVSEGQRVAFEVTLRNAGRRGGRMPRLQASSSEATLWSMACKSATGMTCPHAPFGFDPPIADMPPGASITFEVAFTVDSRATGGVDIDVQLSALNDNVPYGTRVTTAHFNVVGDTLSGAYQLYGSNGQLYAANADFSLQKLTLASSSGTDHFGFGSGPGVDLVGFRVSPSEGFRVADDLLIGNLDLGPGPLPFIAARKFVSDAAALEGKTFLVFGRELPDAGAPRSNIFSAAFSGTTMAVCRDTSISEPADCPAGSAAAYALTAAADGSFVATDAASGDTTRFRVARSKDALVFLRAEATPDGRRFDIGMPVTALPPQLWDYWGTDTRGLTGNIILTGASEHSEWIAPQHQVEDTALAPVAGGPAGLTSGSLGNDGTSTIYAAAFGPIALVAGAPGGPVDGLLQVFMQ